MRTGYALTAFTEQGSELAGRLAAELEGTLRSPGEALSAWTKENFPVREGMVFVGAAGIAVRAIAPCIRNKAEDPAVVCVDETGRWVIPLLAGHLGGANALARRIASAIGGEAVITTATDLNGVFAVDLWAKRQKLAVLRPDRIRNVSSALLRGEDIVVESSFRISGRPPEHVLPGEKGDVLVSFRITETPALLLVPRILSLGIGCRRGTTSESLAEAFALFCREREILPQAVEAAASIDRKKDEKGLLDFCRRAAWPLRFFTAEELCGVPGEFSASAFVENTVGVDNVCERAAVLAAGGKLAEPKWAGNGVTFALAERPIRMDWST